MRASVRSSPEHQHAKRQRGRGVVGDVVEDVRFAWRQSARTPSVTIIAVLTLALCIGANTAVFSVVHRLLLAPLPYPNGNRIVMPVRQGNASSRRSIRPDLGQAWRERAQTVGAVAGASEDMFSVRADGTIDTMPSATITANFLPLLGVRPMLGRNFSADDELPSGHAAVAMISHDLWKRTYGGRADVLGQSVAIGGRSLTIVGVTPPGLSIPLWRTPPPDVWVPARLDEAGGGGTGTLEPGPAIFALLRPGISAETATRELEAVAASLPDAKQPRAPVRALRAQDFLSARERRAVQVLFAAVGALLLIACANLANLFLARAWARQREFAVRVALGARQGRIARQVLAESVSLALVGGLLGVGVAWFALRLIVALRPPALDHLADVRLEPAVLLWTLAISVGTGVLFGCVPAMLAGAQRAGDALRRETRGGSHGLASRRIRSALIILEVAAALVLLMVSGLLLRSFVELQRMPLGFEPRGLVYTDVLMGGPRNQTRIPVLREETLDRLRSLPGVEGAAIGVMPGKGYRLMGGLEAQSSATGPTTHVPTQGIVYITPDYFRVAHIALVQGRLPDSAAMSVNIGGPMGLSPEVVVNREFARRVWPDGHAIGARVRSAGGGFPGAPAEPWSTVAGVVGDTQMPEVRGDVAALQVYSLIPSKLGDVPFIVRTTTSGDISAPLIKHAIASVDPTFFVRPVLSGDTYLRNGLAPTRFAMALLTAFAVIALALAAVGIYGVVAYGVSQRTQEIGVRVALGAAPTIVVRLVLRDALRLAVAGLVIGTGFAFMAMRVLRSMLYGVSPTDPFTFAAVALLVTGIALVASYVPARRALRIDPVDALRAD